MHGASARKVFLTDDLQVELCSLLSVQSPSLVFVAMFSQGLLTSARGCSSTPRKARKVVTSEIASCEAAHTGVFLAARYTDDYETCMQVLNYLQDLHKGAKPIRHHGIEMESRTK